MPTVVNDWRTSVFRELRDAEGWNGTSKTPACQDLSLLQQWVKIQVNNMVRSSDREKRTEQKTAMFRYPKAAEWTRQINPSANRKCVHVWPGRLVNQLQNHPIFDYPELRLKCVPPCLAFKHRFWSSNPGPHAWEASDLPTEPSLQSRIGKLSMQMNTGYSRLCGGTLLQTFNSVNALTIEPPATCHQMGIDVFQ